MAKPPGCTGASFIGLALIATALACDGAPDRAAARIAREASIPAALVGKARYAFAEVSNRLGVAGLPARTWGVTWADFDLNGSPDLLQGNHWQPAALLANRSGIFTRIQPAPLGEKGVDRHACAWGEANGDGRPDLYCVVGARMGTGIGLNQLLISTDDGFAEQASEYGLLDKTGRGRTVNWFDFDSDGDLDIFVGNLIREGAPNVLFRNDGERFRRVDGGVTEELATVGSSWADWDVDGDPDLLVLREPTGPATPYVNDGGTFSKVVIPLVSDRTWQAGAWGDYDADGLPDLSLTGKNQAIVLRNDGASFQLVDRRRVVKASMSAWFDVENDGDLDLFIVRGARGGDDKYHPGPNSHNLPDLLLINRAGTFAKLAIRFPEPRRGHGQAVAAADYNRDGRVDLFVTNGNYYWHSTSSLYENRSEAAEWVAVSLVGEKVNPWGFGARVEIRAGGRTYHHQVTDAFNFQSQSDPGYVHAGIGAAEGAEIRVMWPDGTRDCASTTSGRVVEVRHGTMPC